MRKSLPNLFITAIAAAAVTSAYLTPLYPIYAQPMGNTAPANPTMQRGPLQPGPLNTRQSSAAGQLKPVPNGGPELLNLQRAKNATMEAQLQKKLVRFKDKNKAARLELINTNLNDINFRQTQNMSVFLDKISDILERLKSKASTASSSEIDSAIAEVESQWSEASAAVEAQALKDYSINLNTETTAASDAAAAKNALQSDLKATHGQVVEVRQALSNAISTVMSSLQGGNNGTN